MLKAVLYFNRSFRTTDGLIPKAVAITTALLVSTQLFSPAIPAALTAPRHKGRFKPRVVQSLIARGNPNTNIAQDDPSRVVKSIADKNITAGRIPVKLLSPIDTSSK